MNIYDIRCSEIEMGVDYQFVHEEEFSKEELMDIVEDCLFEVIEYAAQQDDEWMDNNDLMPPHVYHDGPHMYGCVSCDPFREAMSKRGFEPLQYTAKIDCSDRPVLEYEETDWLEKDEKELVKRLERRCAEAGIRLVEETTDSIWPETELVQENETSD